jgi:CubicO group peptidase (beta-lactamase class C family)
MLLSRRGVLDLDQPMNRYLGDAPLKSPQWNANGATVRRAATHTAGLTSFDAICYDDERHWRIRHPRRAAAVTRG